MGGGSVLFTSEVYSGAKSRLLAENVQSNSSSEMSGRERKID